MNSQNIHRLGQSPRSKGNELSVDIAFHELLFKFHGSLLLRFSQLSVFSKPCPDFNAFLTFAPTPFTGFQTPVTGFRTSPHRAASHRLSAGHRCSARRSCVSPGRSRKTTRPTGCPTGFAWAKLCWANVWCLRICDQKNLSPGLAMG